MDETWAIQFCNKKKTHIFVLRSGLFYCKTHFVQLIAPKCERCHNPFRYPKYFLFLSSKLILWKVEWCWAFVSACALVLSVFVSVCLFVSKCLYLNMCLGLCSCMIYIQSQSILDFPSFLIFSLFFCQAGRDGADHRGQILSTTSSGGRLPNLWDRNWEEFVQIAISRLLLQMCCMFHTFDGTIWKVCVSSVEKRKFFVWSLILYTFPYHL